MTAEGIACPSWCTARHGEFEGEESQLHVGDRVLLGAGLFAMLCASVDPVTGQLDGPRILAGSEEWSAAHARGLGEALMALADAAGTQPSAVLPS